MTAKFCVECGEEIGQGRSDKKFCSSVHKSRYHNMERKRKHQAAGIDDGDRILRSNRDVLERYHETSIRNDGVERLELISKGFDPTFYTGAKKSNDSEIHYIVYNFTWWYDRPRDKIIILKNE